MFKILSSRKYKAILAEQEKLKSECAELQSQLAEIENQKIEIQEKHRQVVTKQKTETDQKSHDLKALQQKHDKLQKENETEITERIQREIENLGMSREQVEKLWADRDELIELYIEKLYSLAKHYARTSKGMQKNRGLFMVLADRRNMEGTNFSEFHDSQSEHLHLEQYEGIDLLPHLFSPKIDDVLTYMGEKTLIKDEIGKIKGHEERDGTLLVDLQGLAFRSCMMVEGVRTYRVYKKVEQLKKGSARHNAAIYASSLDEVMASIVVSEETSEVTLFIDGKFIKHYDPHLDREMERDELDLDLEHKLDQTPEALPDEPLQVLEGKVINSEN